MRMVMEMVGEEKEDRGLKFFLYHKNLPFKVALYFK